MSCQHPNAKPATSVPGFSCPDCGAVFQRRAAPREPCACVYFGGRCSTHGEPGVFCRRCGGAARDADDYRQLTEAGANATITNLLRGLNEDDRMHLVSGLETLDDRLLELELAVWRFFEINPTRADLEAQGVHLDQMARDLKRGGR
jgi:uncharacterized C2H2 Zn-finger protein